jgi:hypothetical protein
LFDSLYYSAAVVGVNTSAMVEAAILQKPVLSLLAPEFAATQEGTLHFHYLLPENGGFLRVAASIDEHVRQLAEALRNPDRIREQTERFVAGFIRPHGLGTACTPILTDVLQRAALQGRRGTTPETAGARLWRCAAWPLAVVLKWISLGESGSALAKRAMYETWNRLGRTWRILIKRLILRPTRLLIWLAGLTVRRLRRYLRWAARVAMTVPARVLRAVRHARYQVGVWIRGDAPAGIDGHDGRG